MTHIDRKQHWESVYSDKAADEVSWYQQRPEPSLSLIARSGIDQNAAIIDIGGGASLLMDHLLDLGYQDVTVLDISLAALTRVSQRLAERALKVAMIEADVTEFVPGRQYQLWHDRAAFHFLTKRQDRNKYMKVLREALVSGGTLVLATFAPEGPIRCSGLDIVQYDAGKLAGELGEGFALEEQCTVDHLTPAKREQRFNFFRFRRL